jgi:hypothetical protein
MGISDSAETDLRTLEGQWLDPLFLRYLEARKEENNACHRCWLSSGRKAHEECEKRIQEYFESRRLLFEYGWNLITSYQVYEKAAAAR